MGLLVDIATLISGESNKFLGDIPDTPDNVVVLYNTGGADSQHQLGSGIKPIYEQPTFQVRIRDTSYQNAITRAENIKNLLDGKTNQTINSNVYHNIFMVGDILSIGRDSRGRAEVTLNFRTMMKRG